MKYFLHDTNAFSDEKITELFMNFGYEGLGLFYTVLERLALQEKPIKTDVLKVQLKVGKRLNKCWNFMESLGILSSNNGETFNKQLLNFSEKYQIKKEKNRKKISQWREKQELTESVTGYVPSCNPSKVKLSKVKLSKVNIGESDSSSILKTWNEFATSEKLATIIKLNKSRKASVDLRLKESEFNIYKIFEKIKESDFLHGVNDRGWKVDFDFIFCSEKNYLKILEDKYHNNGVKPNGKSESQHRSKTTVTAEEYAEGYKNLFEGRKTTTFSKQ